MLLAAGEWTCHLLAHEGKQEESEEKPATAAAPREPPRRTEDCPDYSRAHIHDRLKAAEEAEESRREITAEQAVACK